MNVLGEETTTLPEGYSLSLTKCEQVRPAGGMTQWTDLRAWRGDQEVKMRVDNVSASSLRVCLDLWVREILRHRAELTERPTIPVSKPVTPTEFVRNMAQAGMFIFDALDGDEQPQPQPKKSRSPKRKANAK